MLKHGKTKPNKEGDSFRDTRDKIKFNKVCKLFLL